MAVKFSRYSEAIERYQSLTLQQRAEVIAAVNACYYTIRRPDISVDELKRSLHDTFPSYVEHQFAVDLMALTLTDFEF